MNRKANTGDMMSIGYFLFLLILIGSTIFVMSKVVLGVAYDSRISDASLLSYKIERCLSDRDISSSDLKSLESLCSIALRERPYVLHIFTKEEILFEYGDKVSCDLFNLNNLNSRCVQSSFHSRIGGNEKELTVIAGSNLEAETR